RSSATRTSRSTSRRRSSSRRRRSARRPARAPDRPARASRLLRLRLRTAVVGAAAIAQVLDQVGDVGELLLVVALVRLEPAQELLPVRERAAEVAPSAPVVSVLHLHLPSSYRRRKRSVRALEWRSASAHWSRSARPCAVSEYVRFPPAYSEATRPSSSSARRRR